MIARMVCCAALLAAATAVVADDPKQAELAKKPQWQRMLTGEDAKTAAKLEKRIAELETTDDYAEAIKLGEELLALRRTAKGHDGSTVGKRNNIIPSLCLSLPLSFPYSTKSGVR